MMLGNKGFLGFLYILLSLSSAQAETVDTCLSAPEIMSVITDFKERMEPLMATSITEIEIRHNNFAMLAEEPVSGSADFMDKEKIIIRVSGEKCNGLLHADELRVLLCHEMGHVMGGPPYMTFLGHEDLKSSAEGQADYFATSSCLPTLFAQQDNTAFLKEAETYPELNDLCDKSESDEARGTCMRTLAASYRFTQFIHSTPAINPMTGGSEEGPAPLLGGKDQRVVTRTLTREYPSVQCRLETMIAGYKCQALKAFTNFTQDPSLPLTCGETPAQAARPSCWYKPE